MLGTRLSLIDTSNNLGAILDGLLGVESSLDHFESNEISTYVFAGHTLHENLGVLVDEDVWLGLLGVDTSRHDVEDVFDLWGSNSSGQHFIFY